MSLRKWYTVQGAVLELEHRLHPRGVAWVKEKIIGIRDRRLTRDDLVALDSICCENLGRPYTTTALVIEFLHRHAIEV